MPYMPKVPCRAQGCPELVPYGEKYCEKHKKKKKPVDYEAFNSWRDGKKSAASRGYDRRWQKARKAFLAKHPFCAECEKNGRYKAATVVDHIKPHRGDYRKFWDTDNWQALCKSCHDKKTARGE